MFYKKGVLKNCANFTEEHLCRSLLFNNIGDNLTLKKRLAQIFLVKIAKCFIEHLQWLLLYFTEKLEGRGQWIRLFLQIFQFTTRIEIFVGKISPPKTSKNRLWWSHFLIETRDYSLQAVTLLNYITDAFMRVLWNTHTENVAKYPWKRI